MNLAKDNIHKRNENPDLKVRAIEEKEKNNSPVIYGGDKEMYV